MVNSASIGVATLAQRLYVAHLAALKAEIQALETEFLSTHKDIEAIERGDWDDRFKQQVEQQQPPPQNEAEQPAQEPIVKEEEEEVDAPVLPSKESTPASVTGGNKRTRAGRRKTASVTPGPPAVAEEEPEAVAEEAEREVVDVETPPSKRTRTEEAENKEEEEETEVPPQEVEPMKDVVETQDVQEAEQIVAAKEEPPKVPEEEEVEPAAESMDLVKEEPAPEEKEEPPEEIVAEKQHLEKPKPKLKSQTPQPPKQETPSSESDGPTSHPRLRLAVQTNHIIEDTTPSRPKQKPFSALIHPLHAALCSLRSATLFSQPIREGDAPGYYSLIRKPVDLKTLWKQVKEGVITDSVVFHREVARMFANAAMYNAENCMLPSLFTLDLYVGY